MKQYFFLQLKRIAKSFPFVLAVSIFLFLGLTVVLYAVLDSFASSESNKRFIVGVSGDTDHEYMQWGLAAVKNFDETRFSVGFEEMEEKDAREALKKGDISAYVMIPESFVDNAIDGKVDPITFVTSSGMEGVVGLLKKEITSMVTEVVAVSQQGTYGLQEALVENGLKKGSGKHVRELSLEYTELIFQRNKLFSVEEMGIDYGLSTPEYYICAISTLLFVLMGLPYASVLIKKDHSFSRLLMSRGCSVGKQLICEYAALVLAMLLQAGVILLTVGIGLKLLPISAFLGFSSESLLSLVWRFVPVTVMLAAANFAMFQISSNMVSGLLLHFFSAMGMCYISGCLYPVYSFPDGIKAVAPFLPTGLARGYLATAFTGESSLETLLGLLIYTVLFFLLAMVARFQKTVRSRG